VKEWVCKVTDWKQGMVHNAKFTSCAGLHNTHAVNSPT
jgi:hypothetical protein